MNWYNLLKHDIRCGILRKRYLFLPLIFFPSYILCYILCRNIDGAESWIDYMMYSFCGIEQVTLMDSIVRFRIPIMWLVVMCGALYYNLDYINDDLTHAGQQVLVRCGSRTAWFISKCVWNVLSCIVYMLCAQVVAVLFSFSASGVISSYSTPEFISAVFGLFSEQVLDVWHSFLVAFICPVFTIIALTMLQMILSIMANCIISFVVCLSILTAAVYVPSPWVLGNGAMIIRSSVFADNGINPYQSIAASIFTTILCMIIGAIYFKHMDVFDREE